MGCRGRTLEEKKTCSVERRCPSTESAWESNHLFYARRCSRQQNTQTNESPQTYWTRLEGNLEEIVERRFSKYCTLTKFISLSSLEWTKNNWTNKTKRRVGFVQFEEWIIWWEQSRFREVLERDETHIVWCLLWMFQRRGCRSRDRSRGCTHSFVPQIPSKALYSWIIMIKDYVKVGAGKLASFIELVCGWIDGQYKKTTLAHFYPVRIALRSYFRGQMEKTLALCGFCNGIGQWQLQKTSGDVQLDTLAFFWCWEFIDRHYSE